MTPIRRLLLRTGLLLLMSGMGGLLVLGWWTLSRALEDQGAARARASLQHLDRELRTRVESAENLGSALASLWSRGALAPGKDQTTPNLLVSLLQRERLIPVVILLNAEGDGILADRRSGRWTVSLMRREGSRTELREHTVGASGQLEPLGPPVWVEADFRQRPWYQQALASRAPSWTPAYRFQRLHVLGVSYPASVRSAEGRVLGVVDVDLLLDDLSQLIWNARPTPGSIAALTDAEGRALVLPWEAGFQTLEQREQAFLQPLSPTFLPQLHAGQASEGAGPVRVAGRTFFSDRQRIQGPVGINWVLHLAIPSEDLLAATRRRAAWGLPFAALLVALVVWRMHALSRRIADPLILLADRLDVLGRDEALLPPASDVSEVHRLGQALRVASLGLREKRLLEDTLRRTQRIELMGTMAAGIAHDANNQLTAILGQIELAEVQMSKGLSPEGTLARARRAAQQAGEIMQALLGFARGDQSSKARPMDLNALATHVAELLRHSRTKVVKVELDLHEGLPLVLADRVQLEQVLMNLGLNGIDAMPGGGTLTLASAFVEGEVRLEVRDTGTGMTQEVLDHLFQAFFTTKGEGKGTGLGLAMVQGIVRAHGGRILVESAPGKGSVFAIALPPSGDISGIRGSSTAA